MHEQSQTVQYTEDQRDCLQEICNIATGQTADVLARRLNEFVTLPIPAIQIIAANNLPASLNSNSIDSQTLVYAVSQRFAGDEKGYPITGLALMLLSEQSLRKVDSLQHSVETAALALCQPMISACLNTLSVQWDMALQCDSAQFVGAQPLHSICHSHTQPWCKVLLVDMYFQLESRAFDGHLLLLFPDKVITTMGQKLDHLLGD